MRGGKNKERKERKEGNWWRFESPCPKNEREGWTEWKLRTCNLKRKRKWRKEGRKGGMGLCSEEGGGEGENGGLEIQFST